MNLYQKTRRHLLAIIEERNPDCIDLVKNRLADMEEAMDSQEDRLVYLIHVVRDGIEYGSWPHSLMTVDFVG
jgi:hypothetical protein